MKLCFEATNYKSCLVLFELLSQILNETTPAFFDIIQGWFILNLLNKILLSLFFIIFL